MKGQISRYSHVRRADLRYSGLYLQQGRMVTDADLIELNEIHKGRVDSLGDDTVASGVPAEDGIVTLTPTGPRLGPGRVYVDGIWGHVAAAPGGGPPEDPALEIYPNQQDFPEAPPRSGPALVYVDLWEQPVFSVMETGMVDPALHGADTAFRTRSLAQIRLAPTGTALGSGAFPHQGDGELAAQLREAATADDPCDPCADAIDLPVRTGNTLFRLEVLDVEGDADAPTRLVFAWSAENAAELYASAGDMPADFRRQDRIYQFFSAITEAHMGVFADPTDRKRSQLEVGYPVTVPARTDDGSGDPWPFVRRWDGAADFDLGAGTVTVLSESFGDSVEESGSDLVFRLDKLELTLEFSGKSFVAGDYWLVTVREFAPEDERVSVDSRRPHGIYHHYLGLYEVDGDGEVTDFDDPTRRRLSFPPLTDLPASHVSFDNNCPKLYGPPNDNGAQTVQEALDRLCDIEARDIDFTPKCPEVFGDAGNVQEALDKICDLDFSVEIYKYLINCGILCGLEVRCHETEPWVVKVGPGAYHDGQGRIHQIRKAQEVDVKALLRDQQRKGSPCLVLRPDGSGSYVFDVMSKEQVEAANKRRDFLAQIRECQKIRETVEAVARKLSAGDFKTVSRSTTMAMAGIRTKKSFPANKSQHEALRKFYERVINALEVTATCRLKRKISKFPDFPTQPNSRLLARNMTAVSVTIRDLEEAIRAAERDCLCAAALVPCPPDRQCVIALCGLTIEPDVGIEEICLLCCRTVALTWRAMDYWLGSFFSGIGQFAAKSLCTIKPPASAPPTEAQETFVKMPQGRFVFDEDKFYQSYGIDRRFFGPTYGTIEPAPKVVGLTESEAKSVLKDGGVNVVTSYDLDETDLDDLDSRIGEIGFVDRMKFAELADRGDSVALFVRDKKVEGFAVVDKKPVRAPKPTFPDIREFRAKLPDRQVLTRAVSGLIKDSLPDVASDIEDAKTAAEDLRRERDSFVERVGDLKDDFGDLEQRRTKFLEDIEAAKTAADEARESAAGLKNLEAAAKKLREERQSFEDGAEDLRRELDGMQGERTTLLAEIEQAKAEAAELRETGRKTTADIEKTRAALEGTVGALRGEIDDLEKRRGAILAEVRKSQRESTKAEADQKKRMIALKEGQPVSVLSTNPRVVAALNERGITTVGQFSKLAGANWTAVRSRLGLSTADAAKLRQLARNMVK